MNCLIVTGGTVQYEFAIKYIEENINEFNTYKHTFKLNENNNYYWYSTELNN